jgi:diguanylate cyclase (GGDEF)-like protein
MPDLAAAMAALPTHQETKADSALTQARSQLLQLQALVTVVLSYQLLFSTDSLIGEEPQRIAILILMMICGSLIVLPDSLLLAEWFPGALALTDTFITTVLVYLSGNGSSELYLTYFVILLIATTSRTRAQLFGFILLVCAIYVMMLIRQFLESGTISEMHLLRIPLFMIMAIFYGETADRARMLSDYDSLTGLPNRRFFIHHLAQAFGRAPWTRGTGTGTVLSLDLDGFKLVNDTLGPEVGDQLLKAISIRLKQSLTDSMMLARLGSDEFAIAVVGASSPDELTGIAERLLRTVALPFTIEEREIFVSACIGIAVYPTDGDTPKILMRSADAAMHRAKEQGKNTFEFYTAEMNDSASERFIIETNLRRALERNELVVYYQPQVDLATGRITAVEALLRWLHPTLGLVLPMRFIAIAEDTGMIVSIGEWVLQTACRHTRAWQDRGFPDLSVTVNLSARQFKQPGLVDKVKEVLANTALAPRFLALELTESSIMQDADEAIERLEELRALGVHISIDDFGTGYSSLSYLKRFPVDTLKIDQTLIRDIASSQDAVAIVAAVITMAQRLRLKVVAEGVETEAQVVRLREQGCHESQGYAFSQPLPADDMEQLLREWALRRPSERPSSSPSRSSP